MRKFLSTYSSFFMRSQRIQGKWLSVNGEYSKFKVVCGTKKIVLEYAERIYAYMEKMPKDAKLCISQLIIV
jgi:hypothetical protein